MCGVYVATQRMLVGLVIEARLQDQWNRASFFIILIPAMQPLHNDTSAERG